MNDQSTEEDKVEEVRQSILRQMLTLTDAMEKASTGTACVVMLNGLLDAYEKVIQIQIDTKGYPGRR